MGREEKFLFTFSGFTPFTLPEQQKTMSHQHGILDVWHTDTECHTSYFKKRHTQVHNGSRGKKGKNLAIPVFRVTLQSWHASTPHTYSLRMGIKRTHSAFWQLSLWRQFLRVQTQYKRVERTSKVTSWNPLRYSRWPYRLIPFVALMMISWKPTHHWSYF